MFTLAVGIIPGWLIDAADTVTAPSGMSAPTSSRFAAASALAMKPRSMTARSPPRITSCHTFRWPERSRFDSMMMRSAL